MSISAKDVMALRQRTGLGMMECKKALATTNGDTQAAIELLREQLKGKMEERSDRAAGEGTLAIAVADDGSSAAIIELRTETDFTARNEDTVAAAQTIANLIHAGPDGENHENAEVTQLIDELRITTKENISCPQTLKLSAQAVGAYLHFNSQVGALVAVNGQVDAETLSGICQHVTAAQPANAIDQAGLDPQAVEKAKADFIAEGVASGKPAEIAEKISTGKLAKWVDENTLLGQTYVKDPDGKAKVRDILPEGVTITAYRRFQVGVEG